MNILFLCTGNSARSILAESILNQIGSDRFRAFSAGSNPKAQPHPMAVELLKHLGHPIIDLYPKRWGEFAMAGAPRMDLVITVCDHAAAEPCPIWPGQPVSHHWSIPDPATVKGNTTKQAKAFESVYELLLARITTLIDGL